MPQCHTCQGHVGAITCEACTVTSSCMGGAAVRQLASPCHLCTLQQPAVCLSHSEAVPSLPPTQSPRPLSSGTQA